MGILELPSEIIAMIGEHLYVMEYIKALIETHPRFAYEALLYEYMFLHANPWAVEQGLRLACTNGNEALTCAMLIKGASVWRFPFTRCQSIEHTLRPPSWHDWLPREAYPLSCAARNGHIKIVKRLLDYCDPLIPHSAKYELIMMEAIKGVSTEVVKLLLNIKDDDIDLDYKLRRTKWHRYLGSTKPGCGKDTPLNTAIAYKRGEIIRLLLEDGRFEFNFTSLGIAARAGIDDMVIMLLAKHHRTRTAIADAARGARISTLRILLRDGRLNPNMPDKIGWRAMHYAVQYGSVKMLNLLLSVKSIHIDAKYGDHTPFSEAARRGNIRAMQILIETGKVNINSIDSSRWTPLHHAVDAGNIEGTRVLLGEPQTKYCFDGLYWD